MEAGGLEPPITRMLAERIASYAMPPRYDSFRIFFYPFIYKQMPFFAKSKLDMMGIEPTASSLQERHSTVELHAREKVLTHDLIFGIQNREKKVMNKSTVVALLRLTIRVNLNRLS